MNFKKKTISILLSAFFLIPFVLIETSAKDLKKTDTQKDIILKEEVFTTQTKPFKNKNFKKTIEVNSKIYNLTNVKYKELDKKPVTKENDNIIRFLEYDNDIYKVGDKIIVDNKEVVITEVTFAPKTITDRYSSITHSTVLGFQTDIPVYNDFVNVDFFDKYSKKNIQATAKFDNLTFTPPQWQNDVRIPITIEVLNGDYYNFENIELSSKSPLEDMLKNQKNILKLLNLDTEKYNLNKFEFNGGEYKNEKGILCQNVIASGERYVSEYIANYSTGDIPFPNCNGYEISCHYNTIDNIDNVYEYTVLSIAEYEPTTNYGLVATTTVVGAFIIWFFAFNNAIFYVNGKRVYSTKVYKNKIKANKLKKYNNEEITIKITKNYVKRHPNKIINIVIDNQNIATITIPISTQSHIQKI